MSEGSSKGLRGGDGVLQAIRVSKICRVRLEGPLDVGGGRGEEGAGLTGDAGERAPTARGAAGGGGGGGSK